MIISVYWHGNNIAWLRFVHTASVLLATLFRSVVTHTLRFNTEIISYIEQIMYTHATMKPDKLVAV